MSLYRDEILDYYHNPRNFGKPESFTHSAGDVNMSCGDGQEVFITILDGVIREAHFTGHGCAISIAATSLLTEFLKGKTVDELKALGESDMVRLFESTITAGRMNCAMLGLKAMQKAVQKEQSSQTQISGSRNKK